MNNKGKFLKVVAAFAFAALCLVGCGAGVVGGDKPLELVGHWVHLSGNKEYDKPKTIELFKDGTGVVDRSSVTWKVENKRLVFLSSEKGIVCNYEMSSSMLTLIYDDNSRAVFVKYGEFTDYKDLEKKGGAYFLKETGKPFTGKYAERNNGNVQLCTVKDGKWHGMIKGFYTSGKLECEGNFESGSGMLKGFYENGKLKYENNYKDGVPHGTSKGFYESGKLRYEWNYKDGVQHGTSRNFYESGKLNYEGNFENGNGMSRIFYESGKLEYEENYKGGELHGTVKGFYENGELKFEQVYKDGVLQD
jgi:antitoxin component YwqK of YwqJK toxin-antitoxin module